ncbi:rsbT co-antagonist protein RsbR [Halopseudomonas xinjiangensis]|uniref:RsbT co-antagonist protein RsbR n=1 Tax=Halopseudomonas xinjiangensis TaxID=487184 RepID=A0A1H1YT51_9GAMM|nr:STAS domain-containing protein [Halopseudomonas xinjiangensis]SDT24597.1 rsbT co-antagonist protein RsbR [Halopseudomonas xinjiangensis]
MAQLDQRTINALLQQQSDVQTEWVRNLDAMGSSRGLKPGELEGQTSEFITLLAEGSAKAGAENWVSGAWDATRQFLEKLSHSRALQGFDSQQTAGFVFSLKPSLFSMLQRTLADEPLTLTAQLTAVSELLDAMGLHTVQTFQKAREGVIKRQQEELLELSTPVVKLWDGVLALPMIGTLDSQRTQVVMESLLQRIADTGSEIAIIDITGVPTVDTLVAQHLLKTVTAIRLMGADCIISGVRPQIAQTIVHLGLDLQGIVTKSSLADALSLALHRSGLTVTKAN